MGGDLTLEDFLQQMLMIRKMGPIGNPCSACCRAPAR